MTKVYFKSINSYSKTEEISNTAKELLNTLVETENISLEPFIPIKTHFGEKDNTTYIEPPNYEGVIDYLKEHKVESSFIETNVLYRGQRMTRESHIKLAVDHGFTRLPIIIADGDHGENYEEVQIDMKNFKSCKIGKEITEYNQMIVLAHFKGHMNAGFGGSIKQLAMGCASRGGKLAQHSNAVPFVKGDDCIACGICVEKCPVEAIVIDETASINPEICIGCASCIAVCPESAISNKWDVVNNETFLERMAEYAYAATKKQNNIYLNFVFNITEDCDCFDGHMDLIARDAGVLASTDPVALDQASHDILDKVNKRIVLPNGRYILDYAEEIGLGSKEYELVEI